MTNNESSADDADIVDHYRLDHLYTHPFHDDSGKYFTVVSNDDPNDNIVVDAEAPKPIRNKLKTRLTFIKSPEGGRIKNISLQRYKYYKKDGFREQSEHIEFTFEYFTFLIGFLQSLAALNLNHVAERRIPLNEGPNLDEETRKQFLTIASTKDGQDMIREAVQNGLVSGEDLVNISYRKQQLKLFNDLLTSSEAIAEYRATHGIAKSGDEPVWQRFFEKNKWIFGYGLSFKFNQPLEGKDLETTIKGRDIAGAGKIADGLMKTGGIISSLCLIEVKTPKTPLLANDYRADCWAPSRELSGGIAQSQKTIQKTLEAIDRWAFRPVDNKGNPTGEVLYAYNPKSFLIVGNLSDFVTTNGVNAEKLSSFELLRNKIIAPEIITFDELFVRAQSIVANSRDAS